MQLPWTEPYHTPLNWSLHWVHYPNFSSRENTHLILLELSYLQCGTQEALKVIVLCSVTVTLNVVFHLQHLLQSLQDNHCGFLHSHIAVPRGVLYHFHQCFICSRSQVSLWLSQQKHQPEFSLFLLASVPTTLHATLL